MTDLNPYSMITREVSWETQVSGGFPVVAYAVIAPAEPDVGVRHAYVNDLWLDTPKGQPVGDWLTVSSDDWDRLHEEAFDQD